MDDLFKKLIYSGIGLVSMSVDKLQKSLDKLVDEDKISHEEGKRIVDEFISNTTDKRKEFEAKLNNIAEDILNRMHLATTGKIEDLEARVAELESKLGISTETEGGKKASRKKATTVETA